MYERFTDRARKVMQLANQEAQRLKHEYIGTEHILLGLLKEGSGVALQTLTNLTLDPERIVMEVERLIVRGPGAGETGKNPQTPRAKKVIEYAMEESRNLKHSHVGTEHILLGLLREGEGVAAVILANFGLRVEVVRREIENVLSQPYDWGRKEPPPQFPRQWAARAAKSVVELPNACPKCGHAPVIRVIWGWGHLFGKNLKDITAGTAILGSRLGFEEGGPPWVCMQCAPLWSEVHSLAMQEYKLQVAKEQAIVSGEFDKAAQCRDAQVDVRLRLARVLDELSRTQ